MNVPSLDRSAGRQVVLAYMTTAWFVVTIAFLIPRLLPGDPIQALLDPDSIDYLYEETLRTQIERQYGLDRPLVEQYLTYLGRLLRGDLGESIFFREPVVDLVAVRIPWTLLLSVPSLVIAAGLGSWLGVQAGWRPGSWRDRWMTGGLLLLSNLPAFFIGLVLLLVFAVELDLLPTNGAMERFTEEPGVGALVIDVLRHLVLPMTALTLSLIGTYFLLMRNGTVALLGDEFLTVARAKGLGERRIKYGHALPNASLPFFTQFSAEVGLAVTGTIFVEALFGYPGMGLLMFEAVGARDYPLLDGIFVLVALSVLLANAAADLAYRRLDPRVERE